MGIKQATSPPIIFLPLRLCKSFLASSIENPLNAGSKFAAAGATEESRQSKSKVTYIGGDVVCLIPTKDHSNNITAMVAASIMFEIISLVSVNLKS